MPVSRLLYICVPHSAVFTLPESPTSAPSAHAGKDCVWDPLRALEITSQVSGKVGRDFIHSVLARGCPWVRAAVHGFDYICGEVGVLQNIVVAHHLGIPDSLRQGREQTL